MVGRIFITRTGYDPQRGRHIKDPYLGDSPSLGACRPDIRRGVGKGDHIFVISGKVQGINQFVVGGFEVDAKIDALDAHRLFPEQRLRQLPDGQLTGNIIVNARGRQHQLDEHQGFERRITNYVVGRNPIRLITPEEISLGRDQTLEALREIVGKKGNSPVEIISRFGMKLTESQIVRVLEWLSSIKSACVDGRSRDRRAS